MLDDCGEFEGGCDLYSNGARRLGGASLAPTFVTRELRWRRLTLLLLGTVKKGPVEWVLKIGTN